MSTRRVLPACLATAALLLAGRALAQEGPAPDGPPAVATPEAPSPPVPRWEGAIGLTTTYRPEYSGASRWVAKVTPGIFLRYGRFTITNASGFVTRRADDVARGLAMDLSRSDRLRANLALRFDAGRNDSNSAALAGLGDIKPTLRGRLNLGWRFDGPFRLNGSWSVDLLGKGGGNFGDVGAGFELPLPGPATLTGAVAVSAAGDRYMQTYYGVTPEQAARTGYPVYEPKAGFRDVTLSLGYRTELGADWLLLAGAGFTRLVGPAAASPLTGNRNGWGLSLGVARRF